MSDTSPEMEKRLLQMYASYTPGERLRMVSDMFDSGIALMTAGIKQEMPDITETQLREKIFRRLYADCFSEEEMQRIVRFLSQSSKD